ncbi:hypothetical protein [Streptomyces sp. N50]|uniref:hypothetical protein n=1 Tax=Streptomyces sp. N50 TaxID=3081765 RepID=UPI002961E79A|nr:hypothetical protein [Streptomyces sp. N50]WOX12565.1 hypothetical protein R2B38_28690 [Streptomyces sp. N50]
MTRLLFVRADLSAGPVPGEQVPGLLGGLRRCDSVGLRLVEAGDERDVGALGQQVPPAIGHGIQRLE